MNNISIYLKYQNLLLTLKYTDNYHDYTGGKTKPNDLNDES